MGIRKKLKEWLRQKRQKSFINQKQPTFLYLSSFPRLTYQQRDLLFELVTLTKQEGTYMGEFWWRVDPDDPNTVTQIKPCTKDGNFDSANPVYQNKKWKWVAEQAQMEALDRYGYIVITDEKEYGSDCEKWRHFAVNQLGFDFFSHAHHSYACRFGKYVWDKSESHVLAFFFGVFGALVIELIRILVSKM